MQILDNKSLFMLLAFFAFNIFIFFLFNVRIYICFIFKYKNFRDFKQREQINLILMSHKSRIAQLSMSKKKRKRKDIH